MLLAVLMTLVGALTGGATAKCPAGAEPDASTVILGYVGAERQTGNTRVGPFRVLALLRGSDLQVTDGNFIRDGLKSWAAVAPESAPVELSRASAFVDAVGEDHCVYHAWFQGRTPPLWTLLTSKPLRGVFNRPEVADRAYFFAHNTTCVDQGDYEPDKKPPCTRPELLAVSDLDQDGSREYWATEPYMWDTGIKIWRQTPSGLKAIFEIAAGASD